ncbi:hypothetical protein H696_03734 [Fonticula alba]|uniref:Uncharacterized protein n=1 Tax=Fonticula alba TaxID=691883 RepID=A0A058Z4V0_FONAL|nr:hypothetical protein H696_03734 [Fonticula alba]KCV69300.1 hypothetical protein H696_03734 [Fonticula alba]|eukprot:XP_009495865.1 hypothetical protein H696_03734 [Fonticula alba]
MLAATGQTLGAIGAAYRARSQQRRAHTHAHPSPPEDGLRAGRQHATGAREDGHIPRRPAHGYCNSRRPSGETKNSIPTRNRPSGGPPFADPRVDRMCKAPDRGPLRVGAAAPPSCSGRFSGDGGVMCAGICMRVGVLGRRPNRPGPGHVGKCPPTRMRLLWCTR